VKRYLDKGWIIKVANSAVRKSQKESHRRGIANIYTKNKVVYYQLPDGTITMKNPFPPEEETTSR